VKVLFSHQSSICSKFHIFPYLNLSPCIIYTNQKALLYSLILKRNCNSVVLQQKSSMHVLCVSLHMHSQCFCFIVCLIVCVCLQVTCMCEHACACACMLCPCVCVFRVRAVTRLWRVLITGPASVVWDSAQTVSCGAECSVSYLWSPPHTPPVSTQHRFNPNHLSLPHTHTQSVKCKWMISKINTHWPTRL
jgi:hypothetical protein